MIVQHLSSEIIHSYLNNEFLNWVIIVKNILRVANVISYIE